MDNQNENPEANRLQTPQPEDQPLSGAQPQNHQKVVQPSQSFVEEIKSTASTPPNTNPQQSESTLLEVKPESSTVSNATPSQPQTSYNQVNPVINKDEIAVGLSASSLGLNSPKGKEFEWRKIIKKAFIVVVVLLVVGGGWLILTRSNNKVSTLSPYTVNQSTPVFSVNFYPNAAVSQKNNLTYLISTNSQGKQTAIWIVSLASPLSYGNEPTFSYTMSGQKETGSCRSDGIMCVSDVQLNGQTYQINITSQRAVSIPDAKAIFSSVNIQ